MTLSINNKNDIVCEIFQTADTHAFINDSTRLTYTLYNSTMTTIPVSGSSSTYMPYVAASDGKYLATMSSTVMLGTTTVAGTTYIIVVQSTLHEFYRLQRHVAVIPG